MFADLEVTPDAYAATFKGASPESKPVVAKDRPTFPCQSCAGTGSYQGARVHQEKSECFSCGGRGFFYTSHADRLKKRQSAAAAKANKIEAAKEVFNAENEGFIEILSSMASWNDFAADLMRQYDSKGALTEGQVNAAIRMHAKSLATKAARDAERADRQKAMSATVDLSTIHAMFDKAKESGLKKLIYRAEGLVLSPAKASSANFGSIYVKRRNGEYLGKVSGTSFICTREATTEDKDLLVKIAANPGEVAREYGKRVGECSCCGRELTDPNSIAAGIGPICAEGWGF